MSALLIPAGTIPGRTIPIGGSCHHGLAAGLANMSSGSTVIVCRPADLTTGDAYIWSRTEAGQVYHAFRFTGTQVRHFISRGTTNYNFLVDYAALPGLAVGEWIALAHTWDISGATADQRLYIGHPHAPLIEATAYATVTLGAGTLTDDSALNFRTWARGGASNGLVGEGHGAWIKKGTLLPREELQAIANAMWRGLPLDLLAPTASWYTGANEDGPVMDYGVNGYTGTLATTTAGSAPPLAPRPRRRSWRVPTAAQTGVLSQAVFTLTALDPTPSVGSVSATPAQAILTLLGLAPTGSAGAVSATPGIAQLLLTALAPTADASATGAPAQAVFTFSGLDPSSSSDQSGTPTQATLTLSALAPTGTAGGVSATPAIATMTLTALAPSASAGAVTATPGIAQLVLSALTPAMSSGAFADAGQGVLTFSALAPTPGIGGLTGQPGIAVLTFTADAPTGIPGAVSVVAGQATLTFLALGPDGVIGVVASKIYRAVIRGGHALEAVIRGGHALGATVRGGHALDATIRGEG